MADLLFLNMWLRNHTTQNMLRRFETLLRQFPHSRLSQGVAHLRIGAIEPAEPPLLEQPLGEPLDVEEVLRHCREFVSDDCSYTLETHWDLWQYDGQEWRLGPERCLLHLYAPGFASEQGEHIHLDFGLDALFLPQEGQGGLTAVQSNVRSLLRLVHELEEALPVQQRLLETETGENFAERLREALQELA